MPRRLVQLITMAAALASARASAEEPVRVAVMPVQVEGEVSPEDEAVLQQALLDSLADEAVTLDASTTHCAEAECVAELARGSGAVRVVDARVSYSMNVYQVTLSVLDEAGAPVQSVSLSCEICTIDDVQTKIAEAADQLRAQLREASARKAVVVVDSTPAGATVFVDGERLGVTPLEAEIEAGPHELRVERSGQVAHTESFESIAGERSTFSLDLEPPGGAPSRRGMFIAGLGLVGAGAGAAIGGTVLLVLDSRPIQRKCVGDNIDVNGECKFLHDTKLAGAVAVAAGGAVLATGVVLAVLARKGASGRGPKEQARRWRVRPTASGVGVWF